MLRITSEGRISHYTPEQQGQGRSLHSWDFFNSSFDDKRDSLEPNDPTARLLGDELGGYFDLDDMELIALKVVTRRIKLLTTCVSFGGAYV